MTEVSNTAKLNVSGFFEITSGTIRDHCIIEGRDVRIGKDFWMDHYAFIGGGSSFDDGSLVAGDYLHMGMWSVINTARDVVIGNEVGIGIATRIFTHGAYLSALDGFPYKFAPVTIGSRVWLPNAIVNPGVNIGNDVVVLPNSVVTKDLPGGCLYGGTPAKVIERDCFPRELSSQERKMITAEIEEDVQRYALKGGDITDIRKNQYRRHGVRGNHGYL